MHAAFPEPYPAIIGACIAGRVEALGQADLQARTLLLKYWGNSNIGKYLNLNTISRIQLI